MILEQLGRSLVAADGLPAVLPHLLALRLLVESHAEDLGEHVRGVKVCGPTCQPCAVTSHVLSRLWALRPSLVHMRPTTWACHHRDLLPPEMANSLPASHDQHCALLLSKLCTPRATHT
jgi:hypothetical protein